MRRLKQKILFILAVISIGCTAGCSSQSVDSKAQISIPIYEKYEYSTVEVQKGDLEPVLEMLLKVDGFQYVHYSVDRDDLEIDTIYVTVGDKVKTGDTLITFKSGDIESEIEEYQNQMEANELLIDHYKRLKKIEAGGDDGQESEYDEMIEEIEKEQKILEVALSEAQAILDSYSIVAEADGTIMSASDSMYWGYIISGEDLFMEACGTGNYTTTVKDDYDFEVGQIFTAKSGVAEYEMKLASVEDGNNEGERQLLFEPVSDMSGVSETDSFTISITKQKIENVVYVSSKAVFDVDDKYYVYVMDDDGFRDAVEVTVGNTVDDVTIITSGLEGGEQVMIR